MKFVLNVSMIVEGTNSDEIEQMIRAHENKAVKEVSVISCAPIPSSVDIGGLNLSQTFVIFSQSEWMSDDYGNGFWSNEYGWVPCDLATRFTLEEVGNYSAELPSSSGQDASIMVDPVPKAQYAYAMKVRKSGAETYNPWIDFVCFASNVDAAFNKGLAAYPGARICAYEDMKLDMDAAASDPYDFKDFTANPKKYELMKTARINVPADFDCNPFLPGQLVAIKFSNLANDSDRGLPCPVYAVSDTIDGLESSTMRLFANALSSFGL